MRLTSGRFLDSNGTIQDVINSQTMLDALTANVQLPADPYNLQMDRYSKMIDEVISANRPYLNIDRGEKADSDAPVTPKDCLLFMTSWAGEGKLARML
ncbi:hypothetical protein Aduo_002526 [Ancylostoma duodenale]